VLLCAAGVWGLLALFYFGLAACNTLINLLALFIAACGIGSAAVAVVGAVSEAERRLMVPGFIGAPVAFGLYVALPAISC